MALEYSISQSPACAEIRCARPMKQNSYDNSFSMHFQDVPTMLIPLRASPKLQPHYCQSYLSVWYTKLCSARPSSSHITP